MCINTNYILVLYKDAFMALICFTFFIQHMSHYLDRTFFTFSLFYVGILMINMHNCRLHYIQNKRLSFSCPLTFPNLHHFLLMMPNKNRMFKKKLYAYSRRIKRLFYLQTLLSFYKMISFSRKFKFLRFCKQPLFFLFDT